MDISLQARFNGTALTVQKVVVKQDKRSAELSGQMTFIQHYLLDATLKAQAPFPLFHLMLPVILLSQRKEICSN